MQNQMMPLWKLSVRSTIAKILSKTCFKNPINPTFIDLIITNRPKSFQEPEVIETGLSGFYKMSLTVIKVFYNKQKPKAIR